MRRLALLSLLAPALAVGCSKDKASEKSVASASAHPAPPLPAPVASGLPDSELISSLVNPNKEAPYSGPTGTVRGRVVVKGDKSPDVPHVVAKVPSACPASAREAYGTLFREGPGRTLADALVAVTGYKGYVPEQSPTQKVEAKDCFFGTRTLALTFGQRIDVSSKDNRTYIPELLGEHGQPQMVATPGNATASALYPTHIGRYVLIDDLKLFMTADVIVVKFATHTVTGLDGHFEITGVPVGPARVNALLPITGGGDQRAITVEADKPTEVELEVPFSLAEYQKQVDAGAPALSASALAATPSSASAAPSSKPAASGSAKARPVAPRPSAHP
jgi:hypothetical protein